MLVGHPRFKSLELAARAHVPRQKIYEVLDSLVEKGFAQVVQEKTKLFSAVEPNLAVPAYLARKRQLMEHELGDQARTASNLVDDLKSLSEQLLEKAHVAVVPGGAFGTDKHVRISYATSMHELERGLDRLHQFIADLA